jgi:hypothetical protein
VTKEHWISIPTGLELQISDSEVREGIKQEGMGGPLSGCPVLSRGGVERVREVRVESDSNDSLLRGLVFGAIQSHSSGMSVEHVVSHEVGLGGTVACRAFGAIAAVARSIDSLGSVY